MIPAPLPVSLLGDISAITIATPNLENSLQYYQKLGFKEIGRADFPFPWIQITDEALLIMLRKDKDPYLALTYYSKNGEKAAAEVEQKGITLLSKPKAADMIKRYLFQSPDGLNISIVTVPEGFRKPAGTTMLTMNQSDYFNPEAYTNPVIGMFGELAHPVADLDKSIAFWEQIGFGVLSRFTSPYPWAILSDGLSVVGLHQSQHFGAPAITYFAADMKEKTEKLKREGLENYTEQSPGNLRLTTPEQQQFFLFRMGM